jgi:DNA mismatch repair protein MutL
MGKIKVLPGDVVAKIAAGQVIERPANVIKELVENSLDAGATAIRIELEESGFKKIAVFDNGEGMTREDLEICVFPHSTSKISTHEDLQQILTLGFRGEALNSIASVAGLTIYSKTKDQDYGFRIDIQGGEVLNISPEPMNNGTAVVVADLFYNIPARKQFLTNKNYEYTQIVDVLTLLALSRVDIAFAFYNNDKEVFTLPKNQTFEDRIELLLGENILHNFVKAEHSSQNSQITGFLSKPNYCFKTNKKQILFVNGRSVAPSAISTEIRDFYGNLIEFRMHPVFILNLTLDASTLDVNVHPRKESVRFLNSAQLFDNLKAAVTSALQKHDLTFIKQGFDSLDSFTVKEAVAQYHAQPNLFSQNSSVNFLQVHNMYVVVENDKGITLVDQHAAHERILYEKFLEKFNKGVNGDFEKLSADVIFSLSVGDSALLLNNLEFFEQLGFKIEEFGRNKFRLTHAPAVLHDRNFELIITDFLADINGEFSNGNIDVADEKTKKALSYLACRSAIKTGDLLSQEQAANLLTVLDMTHSNYTCPHGRPTRVDIPLTEINRFFKR